MKAQKSFSKILQKISYKNINKIIFTQLETNNCLTQSQELESINSAE